MDELETSTSTETPSTEMESQTDSLARDLFPDFQADRGDPGDEFASNDEPDTGVPVEEVQPVATKAAPTSWRKDMHEKFSALPPDVQEYIDLREKQMGEGLAKDRGDANLGRTMRDIMTPYRAMLQAQGVDEPKAVQTLLNAHYRLSNGSPQEKIEYFASLAASYGIDPRAAQDLPPVDPAVQALRDELNGIKQNLSSSHQRTLDEAKARVAKDVEAFASSPGHPYFDDVADEIVKMISVGYDLKDAYEKAVWANPATRLKEMDRLQAENREKTKREADAARKAKSVNVTTRDTGKTPTGTTATMRDLDSALKDTMRDIKSRSQ